VPRGSRRNDKSGDGQLLSVAILQLRMKLNQVADSELKALCDAMVPDDGTAEGSEDPNRKTSAAVPC